MANQEHLDLLKQGSSAWRAWRVQHREVRPDLSRADLKGADLNGANLKGADLRDVNLSRATLSYANLSNTILSYANLNEANLKGANLDAANLSGADLSGADLRDVNLSRADLHLSKLNSANLKGANLSRADLHLSDLSNATLSGAYLDGAYLRDATLSRADLKGANLKGANLKGANLSYATLVGTNFTDAILTDCHIYGIAAWTVGLTGAKQDSLVITPEHEPTITVDNLKIAQFIYLLLNNQEIRDVIDTIAKKAVLILGRFTPERKAVLDAIRETLRQHNYLPILFDFEKPASRDITETISTLAHLARFIIADLTDPSSIPQELQAIVPTLAVPVQPVLLEGRRKYSMFSDFLKTYHWVLPVYYYRDQGNLLATLKEQVIEPAEQKAKELEKR